MLTKDKLIKTIEDVIEEEKGEKEAILLIIRKNSPQNAV